MPDKNTVDSAVQFIVTGERAVINYSHQRATEGGANTMTVATPDSGSVTVVASAHGTAVGSQTTGDYSTVISSQSVGGRNNTVAGRDTGTGDQEKTAKDGWWARLRTRGLFVAFFTVVGGVAGVVGAVAAVLTLLGWTPWS